MDWSSFVIGFLSSFSLIGAISLVSAIRMAIGKSKKS